jgi:hypothetical protein
LTRPERLSAGMGEIERRHNLKISISKKFEIKGPKGYKTFFQQSVFEMSCFDIINAKISFNNKKYCYIIV